MKVKKVLFCILLILFVSSAASATEVSWISGVDSPEAWTIDPCQPGPDDTISFTGPVGPVINSSYGKLYLGGTPVIQVDQENKVVELAIQGPPPANPAFTWAPVCGLSGEFGPLSPGDWKFKCTQSSIAFELQFTVTAPVPPSKIYYVDKDSPGSYHDGTAWNRAFRNLQDALKIAVAGDTVLVAEGTYKPDRGGLQVLGDKMASFTPAPGVKLIGSCAGYGHANPDQQDITKYTTILSGDLNGNDLWGIFNKQDNCYQVVRIAGGKSGTVVMNGFVITAGQADGPDLMNSGAGIDIDGSCAMLINTTISDNISGFGGGLSCKNSKLSMLNCKITGNKAAIYGGGLYNYASDVDMTNCLMTGNFASMAQTTGGSAIHNLGGNLTILDCTIADNSDGTASSKCKAITSYTWKSPADCNIVIANSILYNGGNEILTNHSETIFVSYSDVQGGWTGTGNINKNPQFVSPGSRNVQGQWTNGDYSLKTNSPCLNKGKNALLPKDKADLDKDGNTNEQLPVDLAGNARVTDYVVDMGAYELSGAVTPPPGGGGSQLYSQQDLWFNVPYNSSSYGSVTLVSPFTTYEITVNYPSYVSFEVIPASDAGGKWTATFDPDPGVIGPGTVTVNVIIRGQNVHINKLSPGLKKIAEISIYVTPVDGAVTTPPEDTNPPDDNPDGIDNPDDTTPPDDPDGIDNPDDTTPPDDPDGIDNPDDTTPPDDPDGIDNPDDTTPPDDPDGINNPDDTTPPDDPDGINNPDDTTPPDDPDGINNPDDTTPPDDPDGINNPDDTIPPDDPDGIYNPDDTTPPDDNLPPDGGDIIY